MIENIFEFNNITAEDVMAHRTDIAALSGWTPPTTRSCADHPRKRPVPLPGHTARTRRRRHRVLLIARDYLLNRGSAKKSSPSTRSSARPTSCPRAVRADVLFRNMQIKKVHMAIVVDEYGGTSGLVTMEDLLEEIVGNIYDETDPLEAREITELEPGVFRVAGHCDLDALRERLGVDIPENDEIDTLSGLIINELSNVPEDGSTFDIDLCGMRVHVDEVRDRRVEWTTVRLPAKGRRPRRGRSRRGEGGMTCLPQTGAERKRTCARRVVFFTARRRAAFGACAAPGLRGLSPGGGGGAAPRVSAAPSATSAASAAPTSRAVRAPHRPPSAPWAM